MHMHSLAAAGIGGLLRHAAARWSWQQAAGISGGMHLMCTQLQNSITGAAACTQAYHAAAHDTAERDLLKPAMRAASMNTHAIFSLHTHCPASAPSTSAHTSHNAWPACSLASSSRRMAPGTWKAFTASGHMAAASHQHQHIMAPAYTLAASRHSSSGGVNGSGSGSSSTSRREHDQDKVYIRGARFFGYHGVLPAENVVGQPFVVDVTLHCTDLRAAGRTDDLSATISYADVFKQVQGVVEGPHLALLETVAHRAACLVLATYPPSVLHAVSVSIRKTAIPALSAAVDSVGVSVTRTHQDL